MKKQLAKFVLTVGVLTIITISAVYPVSSAKGVGEEAAKTIVQVLSAVPGGGSGSGAW
ncbi:MULTISPECIES: hypothetical protein [Saccharibacillus]|uniref:hypothetical protein n=1 Tax=Saccharibacillus TaxID=456492 RepID=UPI001310AB5D|nr:hypothetical protein [Saccharibacillus sp. WB 17]MWJ32031.1 hypothetical protein [Saccharibacillus sp. WB 17]